MDEDDILEEQEQPVDVEVEEGEPEVVEEEVQEDFFANLAENLDDRVLTSLASQLISDYKKDKESRGDWEKAYTSGLDLLGFKYENEGQPFKGASSVTHPLLAESVTQFQAQAYKELLPSDGPVKTMIVGDSTPAKAEQAQRVKDFMNYMVTEVMEEYTPEFDQMLFYLPLAGSAFKKVYFDDLMQRAVSKFVPAEDLVVPYYASDLKDCDRITHSIKMRENDLLKKMNSGFYRDVKIYPSADQDETVQDKYDELEGLSPTKDKEYQYNILEMHVDIDLDEYALENTEKKIKIPYIVTIDEGSQEILSIYRNYAQDDSLMTRREYFIHYKFLPGLGFYGFGLIHMIGGLSKTATSALRQLLDAGTLANLPAGFKSRGIRIRDDDQPFQPGEFRDVDAPGGNIKDQFQLLPFKEPSSVLMQLLGFVVQAGQRFASIADMQVGEDSQNRAVGTTLALMERGSRVMSAIHKRCYYSMRQEFRLLSNVFAEYLPPVYPYAVYGADRMIKALDFSPEVDVIPVADPNSFSLSQRVTLASQQLQIANAAPQLHNIREAYRRVYESLGTKKIDELLLPEKKPEPMDPGVENSLSLQAKPLKAFYFQNHDAHMEAHAAFIQSRMVQANPLVYSILQAHISEHISFKARAQVLTYIKTERPDLQELEQTNPEAYLAETESIIARTIAEMTQMIVQSEQGTEKPDPIVMLKSRELDIKAMDMQRKAAEFGVEEQRKNEEFAERLDLDKMKREDAEEASKERIRVADEKLDFNIAKTMAEQADKDER
ncbi:MAG: hypothetical protein CMF74_00170 [Maricaulis sp.]|nr:hypothetical protein [Maricaulis sp.]